MNAVNTRSEAGRRLARPGRLNRDEHMPAGERQRSGAPVRYTAWLLYALAAAALLVTIVMTARSGPAACAGPGRLSAPGHHAQIETCAPTENPPLLGGR
jgi:hypothetical protein